MSRFVLNAEPRVAGRARATRREGFIPAVVYGRGIESRPIRVARSEAERLLMQQGGRGLVDLKLDGKTEPVMIQEVQRDPVRGDILHMDFYRVSMNERVQTRVPLTLTGDEQISATGAVVQMQLHEIEVECLPADLPDGIVADVSGLEPGDVLTVAELEAPPGVTIVTDPEQVVAAVVLPRAAATAEETEATPDDEAAAAAGGDAGNEPADQP